MSKLIKRYGTYGIGALCAVTALFATAALCPKAPAPASAEATSYMRMEPGASAYLESEGLRFIVQTDNVTKTEIVNDDDLTLELWVMSVSDWTTQKDTANYAEWTKAAIEVDETKFYQLEGAVGEQFPWYASGALTHISDLGLNEVEMVCVPVKVDGSGETPAYTLETSGVDDTKMSLYDVLNCAVLDNTGMSVEAIEKVLRTYSWFGSNDYPVELKDRAAYDALIENVNRGVNFAGKVALNTGKTTPTISVGEGKTDAMPVINTYYSVRFCEADGTLIRDVTVPEGGSVSSDILDTITPATIPNKAFNGWSVVTNVTEDMTITATYSDVWAVTFYDVDNENVLKTAYVKDGEYLTNDDLNINVTVNDSDYRFKGWASSPEGEIISVSDLKAAVVTGNVSYYPVLEQKVAVQVTVVVEDYSAELFSKGDDGKTERFNYLDNGNGHNDVMGAYIGDKKYTDKTTEFEALLANVNLKGFVGDKVSLEPFKTSLPDVYSWVAENDGDVTIVEDEAPQITVKLDANEEVLGFSLLDLYTVYSYSDQSAIFKGLTLLEDGTAGVLVTNTGLRGAVQSICLRTDAVAVADYKAIQLNFKYKAASYLRINLNDGEWASGIYRDPVTDWSNQSIELKTVAASEKNPEETLRVVKFISLDDSYQTAPIEILLTGLKYLKISTTENTILSAKEVNVLAKPIEGNGTVELTMDENGVQVVRFHSEADTGCVWPGRGIELDLSGITVATYSNVIVKFRVHNSETIDYIAITLDGSTSNVNVPSSIEQADLMDLPIQNWEGDPIDYEGTYEGVKANGLGQVWLRLREADAKTNDFTIDIYSIEFVINASAE